MPKHTKFLLVEDDPNDVALMEIALKKSRTDSSLHVVHDGEQAIHYLKGDGQFHDRRRYPLPDVILLDLKMPRMGGFEFLEWLHKDSPDDTRLLPVIVMSSSNLPQDVKRAYELGVNSYLVKPIKWDDLVKVMGTLHLYWGETMETPKVQ